MADKVQLEIVTPTRLLAERQADMVVVPGGDGDFGVLPGHSPLLSTIRPGVIDIHDDGKITSRFFIAGGFAEVTGERVTLLAEEALPVADLDRAEAEARLTKAKADLEAAEEGRAQGEAERQLKIAEAMVAAAKNN